MPPSIIARKVAGTYLLDDIGSSPPVCRFLLNHCRRGNLTRATQQFCRAQPESLEASLVQVESVTSEHVYCRIPVRLYDHESNHPYDAEVRFRLDPVSGETERLD